MKVNLHKKVLVQAETLWSKNEQKQVGLKMHLKNNYCFNKTSLTSQN